jgi:hypothetical protein
MLTACAKTVTMLRAALSWRLYVITLTVLFTLKAFARTATSAFTTRTREIAKKLLVSPISGVIKMKKSKMLPLSSEEASLLRQL